MFKKEFKIKKMDIGITCKERILSDEYHDRILDFTITPNALTKYDMCVIDIDNTYSVVYINDKDMNDEELEMTQYQYYPKVYGLMDIKPGTTKTEIIKPETTETIKTETTKTVKCDECVVTNDQVENNEENDAHISMAQNTNSADYFDPSSLINSGIIQAQRPPLSLTGNGVVICIIDTGIDYTNPAFLDANGNTRILAIWDQTIQTGPPPKGYYYGTEYTRADINRALQSKNPYEIVPTRDVLQHGSAMAGVAAGSSVDGGRTYLGAAPDADIVVVKLKECKPRLRELYMLPDGVPAYSDSDIMLGVKYADTFTIPFERPAVFCLGIGNNTGSHSGDSILSRYLDDVAARRNRAVVVCGGNEGNAAHHYSGAINLENVFQEQYQDVEIRVGNEAKGFFMEFWGSLPDLYNISVRSPGGEVIPPMRLWLQHFDTYYFIYEKTQVSILSILVEPSSGEEIIFIRVKDPTPGIWVFRVMTVNEARSGSFHVWLPIKEFLTAPVYFLEPDPYITLTEPSLAHGAITVSTYNDANNSFFIESGRGFGRRGRVVPDLAAPGVNIPTIYGQQTGSSLAAAMTAGGIAQFLQWAVIDNHSNLVGSKEIRNYFIRGASRNSEIEYPNREWGYGRLNVIGVFDVLAGVST